MCNLDYVYKRLTAGRDVYITDYASDLAVHYSSEFDDEVKGKNARSAGGVTVMCPQSDELLSECTLAGDIISKETYDCF